MSKSGNVEKRNYQVYRMGSQLWRTYFFNSKTFQKFPFFLLPNHFESIKRWLSKIWRKKQIVTKKFDLWKSFFTIWLSPFTIMTNKVNWNQFVEYSNFEKCIWLDLFNFEEFLQPISNWKLYHLHVSFLSSIKENTFFYNSKTPRLQ